MQVIRKFDEERKAWEAEKDVLEQTCKQTAEERLMLEQEVKRLHREAQERARLEIEVERLKAQVAEKPPQGPAEPSADVVRANHEKQLALAATIEGLRRDLDQERVRTRTSDKRAAEAEQATAALGTELERTRRDVIRNSNASDELMVTRRSLERKGVEARSLEDEAVKLREDLNGEKQKVLELKRAAHQRAADWKQQIREVTEELSAKQQLEEENLRLRRDLEQLRKELAQEAGEVGGASKVEELQIMNATVSKQLAAVEQELREKVQESSQLLELFLRHALEPLSTVRRHCSRMAQGGDAGEELRAWRAPQLYEAGFGDLKENLVKIVNFLRYAAEVLEAREQLRGPSARSKELGARGWLQGVLA